MEVRVFGDPVVGRLGPVPLTETMLTSAAVSVVLVLVGLLLRRLVQRQPGHPLATLAGLAVRVADDLVSGILGRPHRGLADFAGCLFVFIAACNLAGQLPGLHPATGSLATTSALALVVFVSVPLVGIRRWGLWRYLQHYFRPNPLLMPIHLVSELSRTIALSLRLFGNVMSGHVVVALLVVLVGFPLPMPFMALELLLGLLQAYIFTVLATVYIGAALSVGEES